MYLNRLIESENTTGIILEKITKKHIDFIKSEYKEVSHYDLAMSLLVDGYTKDLKDLKELVNAYFGKKNDRDIDNAFKDYSE